MNLVFATAKTRIMRLEGTSQVQPILNLLSAFLLRRIYQRGQSHVSWGEPGRSPRVPDFHPSTLSKTPPCLLNVSLTPDPSVHAATSCMYTRARTHTHSPKVTPNGPLPPLHGAFYALGKFPDAEYSEPAHGVRPLEDDNPAGENSLR